MSHLSDKDVVDFYIKAHKESFEKGIDKVYPNVSLVRVESRFFGNKPGKLLDYGCGFGSNLIHLLKRGHQVTGMDTSPYALKMIENKMQAYKELLPNLTLKVVDITNPRLPFEDGTFDYIVCASVLSLLSSKETIVHVLKEFKRILKPGGKLIVDINGMNSEFAIYAKKIGPETYIYRGRSGKDDPMTVICADNKESFVELLRPVFKVEEVGVTSHKFFEYAEEEFIACLTN